MPNDRLYMYTFVWSMRMFLVVPLLENAVHWLIVRDAHLPSTKWQATDPHSSLTTSSTSLSHLLPLCWGANSKTPDLTLLQISAPGTLSHGWRVQQPSLLPWLQHQRPPGWSPTWETEFLSYDKKLLIQGMLLWWGSAWGNTREFLYLTLWDLQRRQGKWEPNCNYFFQQPTAMILVVGTVSACPIWIYCGTTSKCGIN